MVKSSDIFILQSEREVREYVRLMEKKVLNI